MQSTALQCARMDALSPNLQTIASLVPEGARLLDVGCSRGYLLTWLAAHRRVEGRGIELDTRKVQEAIARGLSVVQGDAEEDLSHYQDGAYDVIVLNQILQQMRDPVAALRHSARVAEHIIVSVPNFGHWRNRWYLMWRGRMPVTKQLDYEWFETPNIHFCTLRDFEHLASMLSLHIEKRLILTPDLMQPWLASYPAARNLLGEKGIFLLKRK